MKLAAAVVETTLLDFMAAHEVLAELKSLHDGEGGYARAWLPPTAAECRATEI